MAKINHAANIGKPTVHDVTEDATTTGTLVASGSISISDAYSVANDDLRVQSLGAGDTKVDTFTIASFDGTTKQVSFTIHGVNDAAVIGNPTVHDVFKDASSPTLTATGIISIQDFDQGEASFKAAVRPADGNLGTLTLASNGSYVYSVANSAVQFLGTTSVKVDTFTITSLDGTSKQVSFTIHGNHPAVIGDPTSSFVYEDSPDSSAVTLAATGSISVTDSDPGQSTFQTPAMSTPGNLGNLELAVDGNYTYSVANSAVQYLGGSSSKVDTFTVTSQDGTTKQVSFTIHGANDAAVIGTPTVATVNEDIAVDGSGNLTATGTMSISDADQNQSLFQTTVTPASGNLGSLILSASGQYTYTVANSAVESLPHSKVDTFTVTSLDGTTKDVSFFILDAPNLVLASSSDCDVESDSEVDRGQEWTYRITHLRQCG